MTKFSSTRNLISFLVTLAVCTTHVTVSRAITLDQCLKAARQNSPALKQAALGVQSATFARQETGTTGLPQLRLSAGASFAPGTRQFGYDPSLSNLGQFGSQVILEQSLFDSGRRNLKVLQGNIDISRMTQEQTLAMRDLEFEVCQSFIEVLRTLREVELREKSAQELSEYLEIVRRLNAGGAVAYTDLLKTQVDLSVAMTAASQSQQSLVEAKLQLAALIGHPGDTSEAVSDSLTESHPLNAEFTDSIALSDTSQIAELTLVRLEQERAKSEITEAGKEGLPTLSLAADAGLLTSRENLLLPSAERYNGLGYSVGLTLDIPLVDWGGRKLRVRQKQLAAESIRLQGDVVRRSYQTEYRSSIARLQSSTSLLNVLRDAIKKAEDNFLLTKSKYAAGAALASDVLSAQQTMTEAKIAELTTLGDIQLTRAKLTRLVSH